MSKSLGLLASTPSGDTIFLRGLALSAIVGPDAWHRTDKAQPIVVDVRVRANLRSAGASDEIIDSVSYSDIAKAVRGAVRDDEDRADPPEDQMVHSRRGWSSLAPLAQHLVGRIIEVVQDWGRVELVLMLPKALPLSEDGVGLVYVAEYQAEHEHLMRLFVNGIKLPCLIGVNAHERVDKQYVLSDLVFWDVSRHSRICEDYSRVLKKVTDVIESSSFKTLEALAACIARTAFSIRGYDFQDLTVSVQKPSAITDVAGSGVEITRRRSDFT